MDTPFDEQGFNSFEQFLDVYMGRLTYDSDEEWINNMDALLKEAARRVGRKFKEQSYETRQ